MIVIGLAPLILAVIVTIACHASAGVSLGLFFGPLLLLTFLIPPLACYSITPVDSGSFGPMNRRSRWLCSVTLCASATVGVGIVWLATAPLEWLEWLRCVAVLGAYLLALGGLVNLLAGLGMAATYGAALITALGMAWLTWPIWMSHLLNGPHAESIAAWLTVAHPVMATNAALASRFGSWDRYTIAYQQLTTLNQDVIFTLPRHVIWAVLLHWMIGAGGFVISRRARTREANKSPPVETV